MLEAGLGKAAKVLVGVDLGRMRRSKRGTEKGLTPVDGQPSWTVPQHAERSLVGQGREGHLGACSVQPAQQEAWLLEDLILERRKWVLHRAAAQPHGTAGAERGACARGGLIEVEVAADVAARMRKLLITLNAMVRTNAPWDKSLHRA